MIGEQRLTARRRAEIGAAEDRLQQAMVETPAHCDGDDRFTSDDRGTVHDEFEMASICADCPLAAACANFAQVVKPDAGYWAGRWHGRPSRPQAKREAGAKSGARFPNTEVNSDENQGGAS